jgi:acetyl-CoA carboxylase biotin carboxylase subunit
MRLRRALNEMVITGVETTLPLFRDLMNEPDVINGDYSIHWLEQNLKAKAEAEG